MITDQGVFRDDHLPRKLQHQEGPVEALSRAFEPALDGHTAEDVLISGPSGVGKTVLARHTLRHLQEYAAVDVAHVRCFGSSVGEIFRAVLHDHSARVETQGNEPVDDLRRQLRDVVRRPLIVVLDEGDALPDSGVLTELARVPLVSTVTICHNPEEWLARVDDGIRHGITTELTLDRYHVDELASILDARADQGLRPGVVTAEQLRAIADEVVGIVRYGIRALLAAAEVAGERDHDEILDEDVEDAYPRARRAMRQSNLESLPFHHQVLYSIIYESGPLRAAALNARYDWGADAVYRGSNLMPVGKRSRRKKLQKLREYDLIESRGENTERRHAVNDESVKPTVDIQDVLPA